MTEAHIMFLVRLATLSASYAFLFSVLAEKDPQRATKSGVVALFFLGLTIMLGELV